MIKESFNGGWRVSVNNTDFFAAADIVSKSVDLPYDAMINTSRTQSASSKKGCFANGSWAYRKTFYVPEERKGTKTMLQFDGVYQRAMVYINGDFAGRHPYGYTHFLIDADRFLRYGEENEIAVTARTADDSRWYTGAGIYRDVYLLTSPLVYIEPFSVKITTPDIDPERAVVCVSVTLCNDGAEPFVVTSVDVELRDVNGLLAAGGTAPCTVFRGEKAVARLRLYIADPGLWDVDTPNLYTCIVKISGKDGGHIDESTERFGIRRLSLDNCYGLRVNGKTVKLRGACIHHDNGPLGAASYADAERRRVAKLKEAGFNALRMSHNPASPALLSACDELGMLVMDEAFDMWTINKSDFDYALDFADWWEHDITAMVDKDFNHPCVIIYSIGNEIKETGSRNGTAWGRKLSEKIRQLDPTRFITNGVNGMLAALDTIIKNTQPRTTIKNAQPRTTAPTSAGIGDINNMMTGLGERMKMVMCSEAVTEATEESFAYLDIAGYNYMENRYKMDKGLFPNRLIIGSETFPSDIDRNWRLVMDNNHVLGDFTWTGWDYLGEAGVGKVRYPEGGKFENVYNGYPALTAMAGDIDITGFRRPVSYYREIVFGKRAEPYIAAQRPEHYHDRPFLPPWCWSDSASHWSWTGFEGKPVKVEVYSHADEVELLINGVSAGCQPTGEANRYMTVFDTFYEPGEVTAIAYQNGTETGRYSLYTATGAKTLSVSADKEQVSVDGLVFVEVLLTDENGNLFAADNRRVKAAVEGAGQLIGFANSDPDTEENFYDTERTTYDGRALAVIRGVEKGNIRVTVSAEECATRAVDIKVV